MSNKGLTFIIIILLVLCGATYGLFYLKNNPDLALSQKIFGGSVAMNTNGNKTLETPFGNETVNTNTVNNPVNNTDTTQTNLEQSANVTPSGDANDTVYSNTMNLPAPTTDTPKTDTKPAAETNTNTAAPTLTQTLRKGSKGAEVKILQQFLIDNSYLTGKADGTFGAMTETAVKKFQAEYKLTTDGIVGGKTRLTINELLASN